MKNTKKLRFAIYKVLLEELQKEVDKRNKLAVDVEWTVSMNCKTILFHFNKQSYEIPLFIYWNSFGFCSMFYDFYEILKVPCITSKIDFPEIYKIAEKQNRLEDVYWGDIFWRIETLKTILKVN